MTTTAINTNLSILVHANLAVPIDSENPLPIHVHILSPFAKTTDGTEVSATPRSELDDYQTQLTEKAIETIQALDESKAMWVKGNFAGLADQLIYACLLDTFLDGKHCTVTRVDVREGDEDAANTLASEKEKEAATDSWGSWFQSGTASVKTWLAKQSSERQWAKRPDA